MEYDELRRVGVIGGNVTRRLFEYRDISDTQTTTQVASIQYPKLAIPLTFNYTYDERGNIETISDPVEGSRSYEYDALGQLVRENNQTANKTWTWEYNSAGNIKNRKEYAYTTGTLGAVVDTVKKGWPPHSVEASFLLSTDGCT